MLYQDEQRHSAPCVSVRVCVFVCICVFMRVCVCVILTVILCHIKFQNLRMQAFTSHLEIVMVKKNTRF